MLFSVTVTRALNEVVLYKCSQIILYVLIFCADLCIILFIVFLLIIVFLQISFKRPRPYEWTDYTHLLMKVRGDGRCYQVVINMDRDFDLQWNDQYNYPLYTRGGPYWQVAKARLSPFFSIWSSLMSCCSAAETESEAIKTVSW